MKKHMVVYILLCLSGSSNVLAMRDPIEVIVPGMRGPLSAYRLDPVSEKSAAKAGNGRPSCKDIPNSPCFVPVDSQALIRQSPELQQQVEEVSASEKNELQKKLSALGVEDSEAQAEEMIKDLMQVLFNNCSILVEGKMNTKPVYRDAPPEEKQRMKKICFEKMVGAMLKSGINSFIQHIESEELSDTASSGSHSSDEA